MVHSEYKIEELFCADQTVIDELLGLWECSVRKTHRFLNEDDIAGLKPCVREAILQVEHFVYVRSGNAIAAFAGVNGDKLEMLFAHPRYMGCGFGKLLLQYAVDQLKVRYVDVNEQNPNALGFYEHFGFSVFARSETDDQGNPFPILHMALE